MQHEYNVLAERTKLIMMRFGDYTYWGHIASTLKEGDEVYNALRGAFSGVLEPSQDIIIWHPDRDEKVRSDYHHLFSGPAYRIEATLEGRPQGPGVSASGYKKVQKYVEAIRKH
jgi:GMP synthase-like glutamine amidotransferase